MYKENSELWPGLEAARTSVRYVRGSHGKDDRKRRDRATELFKKAKKGDPFGALPEGLTHFDKWQAYKITGAMRVGIIPDAHIPYHDKNVLVTALQFLKGYDPTHLILNGDIADFFSVSFWEKDPRKRDLKREIDTVREFLTIVRKQFKNAEIIFKFGNHEERWERYLSVKAPELLGVEDFELRSIFNLDEMRIKIVSDKRPIIIGKLFVIHGHEFKWGIMSPVNPARGFFLRGKENCIGSHLHQSSSHSEPNLSGKVIGCWSTGCLCDLHPDFSPINKWNHGFAHVDIAAGGEFDVSNFKVIHGKVYQD